MTAAPLLRVEHATVGYGDAVVVRDVSLEVRPGEFVALLGPSGAGKSTLLRGIAGLLPLRAGTVWLDGARIDGLPPYRIAARGLVMIPEGRRLFGELSVRENLELGAYLPEPRGQAARTLALVERLFPILYERRGQPAARLSGGEQQMVALGRGLMARPRLLLLDDPFLGLARPLVTRFCAGLRELRTGHGLALLAAGQHVRRLLTLADRAYVLDEGRVQVEGRGVDLVADPTVRRVLLEFGPTRPEQAR